MKGEKESVITSVALPRDLREKLNVYCAESARSRSAVIATAIRIFFKLLELDSSSEGDASDAQ